jgi:hypothetical protein
MRPKARILALIDRLARRCMLWGEGRGRRDFAVMEGWKGVLTVCPGRSCSAASYCHYSCRLTVHVLKQPPPFKSRLAGRVITLADPCRLSGSNLGLVSRNVRRDSIHEFETISFMLTNRGPSLNYRRVTRIRRKIEELLDTEEDFGEGQGQEKA